MAPATIPSCCLTAEQKDILIDAVHVRPVIWDCSIPDYQDVNYFSLNCFYINYFISGSK